MGALFAGILAKLAGLGMAAKAGTGIAVAAASVTGAGAAGVLPEPVQGAVATVVATATPFEFPGSADANADFGATVSTDATGADGTVGVDGEVVSDAAKAKAGVDGDLDISGDVDASDSGATGLDRAGEHTTLPPAATERSAQGGLDTANTTPAAGHAPTSVPTGGSDAGDGASANAEVGIDTANDSPASETPAAGRIPASPGRP